VVVADFASVWDTAVTDRSFPFHARDMLISRVNARRSVLSCVTPTVAARSFSFSWARDTERERERERASLVVALCDPAAVRDAVDDD